MRKIIIILIALIAILAPTTASSNFTESVKSNNVIDLTNIQEEIINAFMSSFADQSDSKITSIIDDLSSSYKNNNNSLFLYWKGYALYYNSIYYLKNSDRTNSKVTLTNGIKVLESIKKKNSEDYTLLSMLKSFSCQFLEFPEVVRVSKDATTYIEQAVKLDKNNLRAYYVLANNDYYTPKNYGGGKNVEKYALKAISLPTQKVSNPYLPSWGKQESYELLTNYYIEQKNLEKAKKYVELGLIEFPNSNILKSNKSKLSL
jgi:hypothetical protein